MFFVCKSIPEETVIIGKTMGTTYSIRLSGVSLSENQIEEVQAKVDSVLDVINQQMSTYIPTSEISRFNKMKSKKDIKVSSGFYQVLQKSLEIYNLTDGAFDVTVHPLVKLWGFGNQRARLIPPKDDRISSLLSEIGSDKLQILGNNEIVKSEPNLEVDLSAIAKGYGVDSVVDLLQSLFYKNVMVEIGGEVRCTGENANEEQWRIGIEYPSSEHLPNQKILDVVHFNTKAMATSGDYRNFFEFDGKRYSHTIDPKTGYPVENNVVSVTILSDDCITADAYATALMVMGKEKGMKFIESLENTECSIVELDEEDSFSIFQSSGFGKFLKK
ncbi:MAG: FAD:protein FMN transferase [Candidatus Marinimicrobia bacterium]|nr:FAD:protein FMN transferase [Candidatus Neomarinimicrobiota bacterium]MBL7022991.1 FAD:protein FMN transferase [Candidatus Neomarinimicrobiota bacterium]